MKAEPEQGEKTYRKSSWVRLGIGNPRLGVEVRLGVEMACLGEPKINMKAPKDSSRVLLSVAFLCLGEGPPSTKKTRVFT